MWFSLSSQVISNPECTGLQRSVCQGDAIAGIIPACPLGFPSDKGGSPTVSVYSASIDHGVIARMIVTV